MPGVAPDRLPRPSRHAQLRRPAAGRLGAAPGARAPSCWRASPAGSRPRSPRAGARTSPSCARPRAPRRSPSWPCCSTGRSSRHIAAYLRADPRKPSDEYVSILPLPWIMEQVYVVAMPLLCRIRVSFPESRRDGDARPARDRADPRAAGPARLGADRRRHARAASWTPARSTRRLFEWAVRAGTAALERGRRHRLADLLVFSALRDRLGFARAQVGGHRRRRRSARTPSVLPRHGRAAEASSTARPRPRAPTRCRSTARSTATARACRSTTPSSASLDPDESGVGEILTRHAGLFKGYFGDDGGDPRTRSARTAGCAPAMPASSTTRAG